MPREIKDVQFNSGYNGCDARMSILKNETVRRNLDYKEIKPEDIDIDSYIYVENDGNPYKLQLASITDAKQGIQADWDEENEDSLAFIKNKPQVILDEEVVAAYNVGGVRAGDKIPAGTSIYDILMKILSIADSITVKFSALDSVEEINPILMLDYTFSVEDVLTKGIVFSNIELNNQYYVLLVPEDSALLVDKVFQGGYRISTRKKIITGSDGKKWHAYYPSVPTTGIYTFMYKLIREA